MRRPAGCTSTPAAGIPEEEARRIEWLDYGVAVCGCVARDGVRIVAEDISHPRSADGPGRLLRHPSLRLPPAAGRGQSARDALLRHADPNALQRGRPFADEDGGRPGGRRDAANARRQAVRSVALFPEQNPSPVLRIDRDGMLLYANDTSAGLLESWAYRLGRKVPDEIRRHVEQTLDAGAIREVEVPCGPIVYSFCITPIASEGYANLYGRDITKQKHDEAERQHHLDLHVKLVQFTREILDAADLSAVLQKVADASLELTEARSGRPDTDSPVAGPQVQAVSRGANAPACQMDGRLPGGQRRRASGSPPREGIHSSHGRTAARPSVLVGPAGQGHMPLRGLLGARLLDAGGRPNGMIMVSDKADGDVHRRGRDHSYASLRASLRWRSG